jgi:hypothetical protein
MAEDVLTQCKNKIESEWSMSKYLPYPDKWDALVNDILKLKAAGTHAIKVDGRLDIASHQIYGNPQLDWILQIYNGIKSIGSDEPIESRKAVYLTLLPDERSLQDVPIRHDDIIFTYNGAAYPVYTDISGRDYVDLDGDLLPDIYIIYNNNRSITFWNDSSVKYFFQVSYIERTTSDYIMAGYQILYPDYQDLLALVREINSKADVETSGFARL